MQFQVPEIEFDFDYEDLTQEEKDEIIQETKSCLWDSPDGEECLADVITNNTGWCIKSLSYNTIQ